MLSEMNLLMHYNSLIIIYTTAMSNGRFSLFSLSLV